MAHTVLFRGAISVYSIQHFQHTRTQDTEKFICHWSLDIFHWPFPNIGYWSLLSG